MKYIKGLDTIRALAIFVVLLDHWGPFFRKGTVAYAFQKIPISGGLFGVDLFFVLSGFLITGILLQEREQHGDAERPRIIRNFYIRRSLRIFPIYYLLILYAAITHYTLIAPNLGYFLTYTSNILHYRSVQPIYLSYTWSLAVEEQFYLVWPWIIIYAGKKFLKYILGTFIAAGILSKFVTLFLWHHHYPALMINCTDYFGVGGLYALVVRDATWHARFRRLFVTLLPIALFFCWRLVPLTSSAAGVTGVFIANCFITLAPIVFVMNNPWEWVEKYVLENPVFNYIGKISYGLYLYHIPLRTIMNTWLQAHNLATGFYARYAVNLVVLIAVASLSYYLVEKPFLRLRHQFG